MPRVLISWELGSGFGHLSRLEPVASRLLAQGHEVLFAVNDVISATKWLGVNRYRFLQAPASRALSNMRRPPANYSEILLAEGYGKHDVALGVVESWLNIFRLYEPDILVADHSPMAIFAARILNLRRVQVGSGFELPPCGKPYPCFRPWEKICNSDLEISEKTILDALNYVAAANHSKLLKEFSEIFDLHWSGITSFKELDHYGPRREVAYLGPILSKYQGLLKHWETATNFKVFAYLHKTSREVQWILDVLRKTDAESIIVIPGIGVNMAQHLSRPNVRVYDELLNIEDLLNGMNLAITHGGVSIVNSLLLAGIPIVLIPMNIEQYMHSCRVEELGAGVVLGENRNMRSIEVLINQALHDSKLSRKAKEFKEKYLHYDSSSCVNTIIEMTNDILLDRYSPLS